MKRNTLIGLIIAGVCMIPVICVLLVGIIDGIWPWDKEVEYPLLSIILPKETEPEETSEPAQEGTEDETAGVEDTEPAGQGGQQSGGNQQSGDGQQSGSDETTGSTETTGPETTTGPQDPTTSSQGGTTPTNGSSTPTQSGTTDPDDLPPEGEATIEIEEGPVVSTPTDGTTPGGNDMIPEPTEDRTQIIDFQELIAYLKGETNKSTEETNG